ncbi:EpsG family protein [Clostridium estertheticum]|uniref:EpsG family protein n=1 Tax=Clostridium estertheticum TaxID=238834 RepID=A0AA47EHM6_9CLOT|nr:EpsG family protein [Clostridium estertheticum]MBU3155330.1 EpsG family protein [Clostridium estertheticum]WAG60388.1 EpsG family protein [Clostridium estertheticum]
MNTYIILFLFLTCSSFIVMIKHTEKLQMITLCVVFIVLSLFAGLRCEIGFDYDSYSNIFQQVPTISQFTVSGLKHLRIYAEYGYILLNIIIKSLGLNVNAVFIIVAIISMFIICFTYRKYTKYYLIAIFAYCARFYFMLNMGQIRQGLAMAILLLSIKYIDEQKMFKFVLIVFIAASFHSVSYIMLPMYFINKINIKEKLFWYVLIFAMILGSTGWLGIIISNFSNFLPKGVVNYYYSAEYGYKYGIVNSVVLFRILVCFIIFRYRGIMRNNIKYFDVIFKTYLCGVIILISFNEVSILAARTAAIFAVFEPVFIGAFISIFKNKLVGYNFVLIYIFILIYFNFFLKMFEVFIPYKSIFF